MLSGMNGKLITLGSLALHTGLPTAWLRREADAGRIPCIRAGRLRRFDLDDVRAALRDRSAGEATRAGKAVADARCPHCGR